MVPNSDMLYLISLYSDKDYRLISRKCNQKSTDGFSVRLVRFNANDLLDCVDDEAFLFLRKLREIRIHFERDVNSSTGKLLALMNIDRVKYINIHYKCPNWDLELNDEINDEGVNHICKCKNLEKLRIGFGIKAIYRITDIGFQNICSLRNLTLLAIGGLSKITDKGLQYIGNLVNLKILTIQHTSNLTDKGLRYISNLRNLEHLNISRQFGQFGTAITDDGIEFISTIQSLKYLDIGYDEDLTYISCAYLSNLKNLENLIFRPRNFLFEFLDKLCLNENLEYIDINISSHPNFHEYENYLPKMNSKRESLGMKLLTLR